VPHAWELTLEDCDELQACWY